MAPESRLPRALTPLTELVVLMFPDMGVCGGVVIGTPPAMLELAADRLGTLPMDGVGLLTTMVGGGVWASDDCVATDEMELDLDGLTIRRVLGGGEGEALDTVGCCAVATGPAYT